MLIELCHPVFDNLNVKFDDELVDAYVCSMSYDIEPNDFDVMYLMGCEL